MKKIVAIAADPVQSNVSRNIAWGLAAVLTIMAVAQLYSFEKFIPLIQEYALPGSHATASLVAGLIVISEVFALPFLIRMPLSPLMRWVSLAFVLLSAGLWVGLSVIAIGYSSAVDNSGMLGTKVVVHVGAAQLLFSVTLATAAIWSVTGLWPVSKK